MGVAYCVKTMSEHGVTEIQSMGWSMIPTLTLGVSVMRLFRFLLILAVGSMLPAPTGSLFAAQGGGTTTVERPVISADETAANIGQECTVEFVVKSSRLFDDKSICFLNSKPDHRDKGNFTAVIFRETLAQFEANSIADPASEFLDKKIRVSGRITERRGEPQIVVEIPTQIVVVPTEEVPTNDGQVR